MAERAFPQMHEIRIVPTGEEHVEGFCRCVDVVARERRYIGCVEGPPVEVSRQFVQQVIEGGGVHLVALDACGTVVGWCDVERHGREGFRHAGRLGIGMLAEARGRGLGRRLMTEAIEAAWLRGMERIELEVFASNTRAIALYEALGFRREGLKAPRPQAGRAVRRRRADGAARRVPAGAVTIRGSPSNRLRLVPGPGRGGNGSCRFRLEPQFSTLDGGPAAHTTRG